MAYFAPEQWVALSVLAGIGILAILSVLAGQFRQERELLDLRARAGDLRTGYNARIAALRARETEAPLEVDVVGEIGPPPLETAAALREAA